MLTFPRNLALALGIAVFGAMPSIAAEYQCRKGDSALRLAIEVKKAGHTLPCEVIAEDDQGERAVLFSAQFDRDYCPARIENTRSDLAAKGWLCEKSSAENIVRGTGRLQPPEELAANGNDGLDNATAALDTGIRPAKSGAAIADRRQCRRGGARRQIRIEVEDSESGKPCALIYWAEDDQSEDGQLLWRAVHDADFCPKRLNLIVKKWTTEGWQCEAGELQTATLSSADQPEPADRPVPVDRPQEAASDEADESVRPAPELPSIQPVETDPKLRAIIEADAKRIGEWMEVEPAIEIAARGDLNDDGNDDAVVFLAYQSDQAAYRQYLMSYLVAEDSYELASVKLLTGVNPPPAHARVDQIDQGIIWLSLPGNDGADDSATGYILRNQQLVEVNATPPSRSTAN